MAKKKAELEDYIATTNPNIVLLQKTYLKPSTNFNIRIYITFLTDTTENQPTN